MTEPTDAEIDAHVDLFRWDTKAGRRDLVRAALAVWPRQQASAGEPVWIRPNHLQHARKAPFLCRVEPKQRDDFVPLYTTTQTTQAQAGAVPLTDEQITEIWAANVRYHAAPIGSTDLEFARDIERAHGIGIKYGDSHG